MNEFSLNYLQKNYNENFKEDNKKKLFFPHIQHN